MREHGFLVKESENNYKIKDFLRGRGVSQEIIKKVKIGGILINGNASTNINDRAKTGDEVKIILPPDKPNPHLLPVKAGLSVLYEDEYFIAVNKEKGVITHSSRGSSALSLEQLVAGYFLPEEFTFRAVNRLDRDTSGVVLIAKDELTACFFSELFRKGEVKKTYTAIVKGEVKDNHFIVEKPIRRERADSMKRVVAEDGKYAKTECYLVERLEKGLSKIKILLHTGRTHQIRVHLSSVGLPLYADALYGEEVKGETYALVADSLEFIHPFTCKRIMISV